MKIIELRFKNINSLYGEWLIDFTNPEYTSNGIFALTGPTGSGKSTILDAVCLALYGRTPRLNRITKSENEIMSRQTGECFSEVTFESQEGRFKCFWEQHRAHRNSGGNLGEAFHEISEAETGVVIENKKSLVPSVIEEKTGMDFDRFIRSILLAQGSFDIFLKASQQQKSKILEQITGTEIYSRISQTVHERNREEKNILDIMQAETKGITLLEADEEKDIRKKIKDKKEEEKKLASVYEKNEKAVLWLKGIKELENEIGILSEEKTLLDIDIKSFKPDKEKLEKAVKASVFDSEYTGLTIARNRQLENISTLSEDREKLPEAESFYKEKLLLLEKSEKNTAQAKYEFQKILPLTQEVRSLDQKLSDLKILIDSGTQALENIKAEIENNKIIKHEAEKKIEKISASAKKAEDYLKQNKADEELISSLTGIEEQINSLMSRNLEIEKIRKEKLEIEKEIIDSDEKNKNLKSVLKDKRAHLEENKKLINKAKLELKSILGGKLLREYTAEKEALNREIILLEKIKTLEKHRKELEDGKPCPLCGSEKHPYAEGNIPDKTETEEKAENLNSLIKSAEEKQEEISSYEKKEAEAAIELSKAEQKEAEAVNERKMSDKMLKSYLQNIKEAETAFNNIAKALSDKLSVFKINNFSVRNAEEILVSLKKRNENWIFFSEEADRSDNEIKELKSEIKKIDAVIETISSSLSSKTAELELQKKNFKNNSNKRVDLFNDKNPDTEESRINSKIKEAENNEKNARIAIEEASNKLKTLKEKIQILEKNISDTKIKIDKMESSFIKKIADAGFPDEKYFADSRLDSEESEQLSLSLKELDIKNTELNTKIKDRKNRLLSETEKKLSSRPLDELEAEYSLVKENLSAFREELSGLTYRIADNEKAKERIKNRHNEIEAQKRECLKWSSLHRLIGSADGNKFRTFAQGITFEIMVSHANRQLEKMTDRYLLVHDKNEPLELNVADNYQAGEIRSVKNLSGGESFIVSLSLALGLSKMAGRKVRVDSLFLDEGFGTLDEDALETALETLSSLRQDGKLIGIISHVYALKERISTQICVSPVSGGKSIIEGPGCRKIS